MKPEPFTIVSGVAAPLLQPDVDTDSIMPKQFLKGIDRDGLRDGFLFDMRFSRDGRPRDDFVLNTHPWSHASFLVVGSNFGCGSSREHAVWGLRQFGIRAVIGTTFGGIIQDNCLRNGVLAISLPEEQVALLAGQVGQVAHSRLSVDLPEQSINVESSGLKIPFEVDALPKDALIHGLDGLQVTLRSSTAIADFERAHLLANPWLE